MNLVWIVRHVNSFCWDNFLFSYTSPAECGSPPKRFRIGGYQELDTRPAWDCGTRPALGVYACCGSGGNCGKSPEITQAVGPLTLIVGADADLGGLRTLEPLPQFTFTKSPLPADWR